MKRISVYILAFTTFISILSCKKDVKSHSDTEAVVTDTIPKQVQPEYMYVTAVSGLTLREHPNLQSTKLAVMPLGTKVKITTPEKNTTMTVGGIAGGMDEVEYNNRTGYAFNGFLSKFAPPGEKALSKTYAEELKKDFPNVVYSETTGEMASKPSKIETIVLPTDKWHEAFFMAQQLFQIPRTFAFPNPQGSNSETQQDNNKIKNVKTSKLEITRNSNEIQEILYTQKSAKSGFKVTIVKDGNNMKIERDSFIE